MEIRKTGDAFASCYEDTFKLILLLYSIYYLIWYNIIDRNAKNVAYFFSIANTETIADALIKDTSDTLFLKGVINVMLKN